MKFAPMKEILKLAEERNVAYGAYVTVSYEMAKVTHLRNLLPFSLSSKSRNNCKTLIILTEIS